MKRLWVIMPVYNEQECIAAVVKEWLSALKDTEIDFTLCVLNDGSSDGTLRILRDLAAGQPALVVVDKPNSGHGQTCLEGYRLALAQGAEWVLHVDSDGQCDPALFPRLAGEAARHRVVYGFRRIRRDGCLRNVISRGVSLCTFVATGVWVRDANVPYRLMHATTLTDIVDRVPRDFRLANILVAVMQQKLDGIHWVDIHFRRRSGGTSSVNGWGFLKRGIELYRQLKRAAP
jgi:glycosyltransferase involved in cell wall biosynthesis